MFECFHNVVTDKENSDCVRNANIFWTLRSDLYVLALFVLSIPTTTSEISANVPICYAFFERTSEPPQRRRAYVKRATFASVSNGRFYNHWQTKVFYQQYRSSFSLGYLSYMLSSQLSCLLLKFCSQYAPAWYTSCKTWTQKLNLRKAKVVCDCLTQIRDHENS